jgi:hypothetical protein
MVKRFVRPMRFSLTKHLGGGLHDGERRALGVVDEDWDTTYVWLARCEAMLVAIDHIPLGSRRRNHSFFCSLVMMSMTVVVHSVP